MASISSENDPRSTRSSAKRRKKQSSKTDPLESSKVSGIEDGVDHLLPERVLGSASYNTNSKLNIYSTPEFLGDIAKILAGSSDFERLLKSQFGKLFKYPVCQTAYSARLIHSLLCRQLVTKKRHELWFVFGGKPLRFSLREFHITTGLECKPIPSKEDIKSHQKEEEIPVWKRLFGSRVNVTAFDVSDMLKDDLKLPDDKKMSCWKRFSLVLILLVDGVIVCSNKDLNITPEYVKMLDDHPFFLSYPWGREAFSNTMERFGPPDQSKTDPITELKARLCQMSSCCYGFPLALQMLAFEAIPLLLSKIPNPNDKRDYTQMTYADLSTILILNQKDILKVEADKQLKVAYTLVGDESVENMDFGWDEDAVDVKVDYMEKLLIEGHEFTQSEWPCVDTSSPCVTVKSGTNTDTSGLVPPPPGGVKKAPTRRGGVKKEPAKRGGNAEKKKKDDVEKKDDGDTIEMLKHFIIEQHKETVSTLKKEMEKLFEGLTKCDCGGLRFPKNTTTEQNQEDGKDNTTTEQNQEDGKANTTTEQNLEGGKTDVEVINLETGNTARGKKKRKRSERESWKCPEEGVDREEGESFANSYERNRWNEAYTGVQNIIESVDKVDISAPQDTTKEDSPQGMEFENDYVSGDYSPFAEHNAFAVVPSGLENGHEQTCWEPINADRKSFRESVDRVDMSDPQETAKEDSLQGMEFENECVSGDDSRIAEHNAFVILPSTLESVHEETCGEPKIAERKTFGEECLASSPKTPEELVNNKRVPRASRFVKGGEYSDPKLKALFARKQKAPEYRPMSCVDLKEFYELKQLLVDNEELTFEIVTKHIVTYRFFLDIAEAQKPLETKHVQVIMSMLWRRRGEVYTKVRAAFIDTWFLTLLQQKYKNFKACKNKKKFNWGVNLRTFVTGRARARTPKTFLQHIDLVYIPMKWSTSHWVGLVINLRLCKVQVFDPLIEARSDEEVNSVMAPVVEMIPWLVKEAVGKNYTKNFSTDPLTWERVKGLYQNQRGGDSGPVATKFLEMHAYGLRTNDMRMITDEVVDEFRKVYAMDAYVEFIESGEAKKP